MTGIPYLAARKIAFSPTFRVSSQSCSSRSVATPSRTRMALLCTMSTRPNASSVRANMPMTSSRAATSVRTKTASPPAACISPATCRPPASSTSAMQTEAPSRARTSAVARPMPEAAPVTMAAVPATLPVVLMRLVSSSFDYGEIRDLIDFL